MRIKQDPITKLWCREDGAILMPPANNKFPQFRWTFGSKLSNGYLNVGYHGKYYYAHQIICRAFNGLAPEGKPEVDHIDRCKANNKPSNLRWVDRKENQGNRDYTDQSIAKYSTRCCDDRTAYMKAKAAKMKAQGLTYRRGPDGKWGWYPRIHAQTAGGAA